jgi:hypothetical protein
VQTNSPSPASDRYEAPQVERVMVPEEVEREVHYAGEATPVDDAQGAA